VKIQPLWVVTPEKQTNKQTKLPHMCAVLNVAIFVVPLFRALSIDGAGIF
jgi:hypothetical protein